MAWLTSLPTAIKVSELMSTSYVTRITSASTSRATLQTLTVLTEEWRGLDATYCLGTTHGIVQENTSTDVTENGVRVILHTIKQVNKQRANEAGGWTMTRTTTTDQITYYGVS